MKKTNAKKTTPTQVPIGACTCEVGPYLGYSGLASYDVDDACYTGQLLGIDDVITFVGDTPQEVAVAFRDSVDDYLDFCRRHKRQPNKPFSGKFTLRLLEDLHRQLAIRVQTKSVSLNALVTELVTLGVK